MCNFSVCNELIFRRFCFLNWVVVPYCFFAADDIGAPLHMMPPPRLMSAIPLGFKLRCVATLS